MSEAKRSDESYLTALLAENSRLLERVRKLQDERDRMYDDMLLWRGINREGGDTPCKVCGGSGVRAYGNTATWRGGIGGQMITSDICDRCWGSGNAEKPWQNLRRLYD